MWHLYLRVIDYSKQNILAKTGLKNRLIDNIITNNFYYTIKHKLKNSVIVRVFQKPTTITEFIIHSLYEILIQHFQLRQ